MVLRFCTHFNFVSHSIVVINQLNSERYTLIQNEILYVYVFGISTRKKKLLGYT